MASVDTYNPINTLKPVAKNIWLVDGSVVTMRFYGVSLPFSTRMVIIRLANGDLFVHSPTELTASLKAEVQARGRVRHLVSPNKFHWVFIREWAAAYPEAITWASPGVRERADITFQRDLTDTPDPAWAAEIDQHIFRGSRVLEEVVFYHKASRTLLLADMIENFERDKIHGRAYQWLLKAVGVAHPSGKTPRDLQMTFWGHKAAARASARYLLAWEPERIILAHGRWYAANGTAELRRAFRWVGNLGPT